MDTSVVLRLLTGEPEAQARRALAEMRARIVNGDAVCVSDLVVSEVYFALQYHYGVAKAETLRLLRTFLAEPGVRSTGAAAAVLATPGLATADPGFVDRLIHAEYRRLAGEMLTFEKSAKGLPGVRVLMA